MYKWKARTKKDPDFPLHLNNLSQGARRFELPGCNQMRGTNPAFVSPKVTQINYPFTAETESPGIIYKQGTSTRINDGLERYRSFAMHCG